MGEHAQIHVNTGKNLRGYKRKHPYPRKVSKVAVFPQNIPPKKIYTPKIYTPKIYKIYWNINKYSPWQTPWALLL